ncbi:MAG: G8 domain-containing protein, partial [Actinomycetota bacterium]
MSTRTRAWLAASIAVLLVAGVVAWRVVRDEPGDVPAVAGGGGHHGPGPVELPAFDVRSVRAGAWSAPGTWSTGKVPAAADVVHVEHAVTLDTKTARARQLWLNAPLRFAGGKDTRLTMHGSLVVDRDGLLEMRQADPGRTAVLAFDVADEQAMKGGFQFELADTGLWVLSGGRAEIHGAPVRETWATLLPGAGALGA